MACYFNGHCNLYSDPRDWTDPDDVAGFLDYLYEVADLMSDTTPRYGNGHGWYASFSRVNTDAICGWSAEDGLYDSDQFDGWIENFIVPYANYLKSRGIYLVLSATGPVNTPDNGTDNAGVEEGRRLRTFWERVANHPGVKSADNIMFELMNEPVNIESSPGNGEWGNGSDVYFEAFTNWLQPVIDVIRNAGADNIIWVSTLDWQGSPHQWARYPFTGENIGVACHFYPTYGGVFDDAESLQSLWDRQYKPAADLWPMIITEMFWTPYPDDPWNLVNGHTDGFGNNVKNAIDNQGNVSYIVGFIGDLVEDLNESRPYECSLSPAEGAQAYFEWQPQYAENFRSYGSQVISGKIESEDYESMSGIRVESNPGNIAARHIGYINSGDWSRYRIDVQKEGRFVMRFRVATGADENSEIVVKNQNDTTIGTLTVDGSLSDGWHDWYTDSLFVDLEAGEQEITVEYEGDGDYLYNIDWFDFKRSEATSVSGRNSDGVGGYNVWAVKNPVSDNVEIFYRGQNPSGNMEVELYDMAGKRVFVSKIMPGNDNLVIDSSEKIGNGLYLIVLSDEKRKVAVSSMVKF
ncbi:MAG: carbohydrate-binding protein [Chitinispirillaceae bacterium]